MEKDGKIMKHEVISNVIGGFFVKSQEFTPEIKKAILQWYQDTKLSQQEIADKVGISNQAVSQWFSGTPKAIRKKNWERLYPYIAKYLPDDYTVSGPFSINNSGISIQNNKGKINQVNHVQTTGGIEDLMERIIDNPELSAEAKIEMLKMLKKEAKQKE